MTNEQKFTNAEERNAAYRAYITDFTKPIIGQFEWLALGTAEEQAERHKRWCRKRQIIKDYLGVGCRKCVVEWAQMPYEEENGN